VSSATHAQAGPRRRRTRRAGHGFRRGGGSVAGEDAADEIGRAADRRLGVIHETVRFLLVIGLLAIFFRPAAFWVGIFWGFGLMRRWSRVFIEPELRQRWIDREVHRRLDHEVGAHRRDLEGRHSRHIGELAADVAQEIRDPIHAATELVRRMGEDPASRGNVEHANIALEELGRVERSISHLLRFAREGDFEFEELDLEELIDSAVGAMEDRIHNEGITLRVELASPGRLFADRDKLRRVVVNLLGNAFDAVATVTRPEVLLEAGHDLAGSEVWIRVRDNGPGIPEERIERIWSPFYSSKQDGSGLGLAITKKLVEGHSGQIEVGAPREGGSEFIVILPRQRNDGAREHPAEEDPR